VNLTVGRARTTDQDLEQGGAERRQGLGDGERDKREPSPAHEQEDPHRRERQCKAEAVAERVEDERHVRE
jgi:hypothetical protein